MLSSMAASARNSFSATRSTSVKNICTTNTITARRSRSSRSRGTTTSTTTTSATTGHTTSAHTSTMTIYHNNFGRRDHEDTSNEPRWRQVRHDTCQHLPDWLTAPFLAAVMYLAEVITAEVVAGFVLGRWRRRFYQRARKNRRAHR